MSNGGPHGDKWNPFPGTLTDEQFNEILNATVDGYTASAAVVNPSTGTLWVGYYGNTENTE